MNKNLMESGQLEELELMPCEHFWLIEPAAGPTSQGACRLCGVVRPFANYLDPALVARVDRREAWEFEAASKREGNSLERGTFEERDLRRETLGVRGQDE